MASANWMKCTASKVGGLSVHLDIDKREKGYHSNPHINQSISRAVNFEIGTGSFSETLNRLKERTKEVDRVIPPQRKRKDRIVAICIEIPCPEKISDELNCSNEFFGKIYGELIDFFGQENVHGGFVHKDERHEYYDELTHEKKISLEHMHVIVSAFTPQKGINGKEATARWRMRELNKQLDDMCYREFGLRLNTGEKPRKKTVEQLKSESKAVEKEMAKVGHRTVGEPVVKGKGKKAKAILPLDVYNLFSAKVKICDNNFPSLISLTQEQKEFHDYKSKTIKKFIQRENDIRYAERDIERKSERLDEMIDEQLYLNQRYSALKEKNSTLKAKIQCLEHEKNVSESNLRAFRDVFSELGIKPDEFVKTALSGEYDALTICRNAKEKIQQQINNIELKKEIAQLSGHDEPISMIDRLHAAKKKADELNAQKDDYDYYEKDDIDLSR